MLVSVLFSTLSVLPNVYLIANNKGYDVSNLKVKLRPEDIVVKFNRCNYAPGLNSIFPYANRTFHYAYGANYWHGFNQDDCHTDCKLLNSTIVTKIGGQSRCDSEMPQLVEKTFISPYHEKCGEYRDSRIHGGTIGLLHMHALYPYSTFHLVGFTQGICDDYYMGTKPTEVAIAEEREYIKYVVPKLMWV